MAWVGGWELGPGDFGRGMGWVEEVPWVGYAGGEETWE